ncbi:hypothetical protein [Actinomadura chokoriensis]|uniref:Uncharacterized protein n=1 Tax=Actinomadura chokoriensis TaxID=454156 RepID=A0ABV4QWY0_9ACTN
MTAQMRTGPVARDPEFRGIDPPALNQVIKQLQDAQNAIQSWLNAHRPPPGVSAAGYRQADQVAQWAADQLGMLSRRYNYAITHPSPGGGVGAPTPPAPAPVVPGKPGGAPAGTPQPVKPPPGKTTPSKTAPSKTAPSKTAPSKTAPPKTVPHQATFRPTPRGAGDIGNFPTRQAAAKAARTDALVVVTAVQDGRPVPDSVWKHLRANADDPDYTEKLYERLGPAATADLLKAAGEQDARGNGADGDGANLKAVQESLGVSSHHMTIDVKWLRTFLAEADRAGIRPVAVQVLTGAGMSERTRAAVAKLDLSEPRADTPQATSPHTTTVA